MRRWAPPNAGGHGVRGRPVGRSSLPAQSPRRREYLPMRDLARYRANPLQRGVALLLEAQLHAEAGRRNDALDALERALADGCRYRRDWLEGNAGLASLREDARFRDVIER